MNIVSMNFISFSSKFDTDEFIGALCIPFGRQIFLFCIINYYWHQKILYKVPN